MNFETRLNAYGATAVACLIWALVDNLGHLSVIVRVGAWGAQLNSILAMQFKGLLVLVFIRWFERHRGASTSRWWQAPLAVVAGAFGGSAIYWLISQPGLEIATHFRKGAPYEAFASFVLRHGLHGTAVCGLATTLLLVRRDALSRLANLQSMQSQCAERERRLAAVQLAQSRSRIEPLELQQRLADLETLYQVAPHTADQALLELSRNLRASIDELAAVTSMDPGVTPSAPLSTVRS